MTGLHSRIYQHLRFFFHFFLIEQVAKNPRTQCRSYSLDGTARYQSASAKIPAPDSTSPGETALLGDFHSRQSSQEFSRTHTVSLLGSITGTCMSHVLGSPSTGPEIWVS